jgi:diguanylate cyclase (GGDEF)-like protein/PAS domain S-box-containing protein
MPEENPPATTPTWQTAEQRRYVRVTEESWQSALRAATLLEQAHEAIVGVSADGTINVWNQGAERLYGYDAQEACGASLTMLLPETHARDERRVLRRALAGDTMERDTQRVRKDGSLVEVSILSSAVTDPSGAVVAVCETARDISARRVADARLKHRASHDGLTGLLNRQAFEDELERALAFTKRYELETALLVIDIDNFKLINDTYGHRTGDAALRRLAELMRGRLRRTDWIGRLGGDEFAIILPGVDAQQARRVALELLDALRNDRAIMVNGTVVPMTASVGLSRIGTDDASPGEVLARTDAALYEAKRAGRDRAAEALPADEPTRV